MQEQNKEAVEYVTAEGDEDAVIGALSAYVGEGGAKLILKSLPLCRELLGEGEFFEEGRSFEGPAHGMGFMVPRSSYYINLKKTTLALLGLLLDVYFTKGFTSFLLSLFGVTADSFQRLSDVEKCVLLFLRSPFVKMDRRDPASSPVNCIRPAAACPHRTRDLCMLPAELAAQTIASLQARGIVKRAGDGYVVRV